MPDMKVAVAGAGAIGSYLGAKLLKAGEDVSLIARGRHLEAMKSRGLRVIDLDGEFQVRPMATDDPSEIGQVDVVYLTVKAHSVTSIAPTLEPLFKEDTTVVVSHNGLPWWYFLGVGGPWEGVRLETVDPDGLIARSIDQRRVVGCVFYPSIDLVEPGVIQRISGTDRITIGEPDGSRSDRCQRIADTLVNAGLSCNTTDRMRFEIWEKLLGSGTFNLLSALTRATLREVRSAEYIVPVARGVMKEMESVARGIGLEEELEVDRRVGGGGSGVGHHKMSMLQDVELGRPLELEGMIGVVLELGQKLNLDMPFTSTLYACAKLLDMKIQQGAISA